MSDFCVLSLSLSCFSVKGDRTFSTLQANCSFTSKSKISTPFPLFHNGEVGGIITLYVLFHHALLYVAKYQPHTANVRTLQKIFTRFAPVKTALYSLARWSYHTRLHDCGSRASAGWRCLSLNLNHRPPQRRHWQNCTSWASLCPFILSCLCNLSESLETNPVLTIQDSLWFIVRSGTFTHMLEISSWVNENHKM